MMICTIIQVGAPSHFITWAAKDYGLLKAVVNSTRFNGKELAKVVFAMMPSQQLSARTASRVITAITTRYVIKNLVEGDMWCLFHSAIVRRLIEITTEDPGVVNGNACLAGRFQSGRRGLHCDVHPGLRGLLTGMAKNHLEKVAKLKELVSIQAALVLDNE